MLPLSDITSVIAKIYEAPETYSEWLSKQKPTEEGDLSWTWDKIPDTYWVMNILTGLWRLGAISDADFVGLYRKGIAATSEVPAGDMVIRAREVLDHTPHLHLRAEAEFASHTFLAVVVAYANDMRLAGIGFKESTQKANAVLTAIRAALLEEFDSQDFYLACTRVLAPVVSEA